jgi:hypothetical protein
MGRASFVPFVIFMRHPGITACLPVTSANPSAAAAKRRGASALFYDILLDINHLLGLHRRGYS